MLEDVSVVFYLKVFLFELIEHSKLILYPKCSQVVSLDPHTMQYCVQETIDEDDDDE